jgi:RNA polymerase-binding transcription factor DksA
MFEYEEGCGVKPFIVEESTKICKDCGKAIDNCRLCLSATECLQCSDGFKINENRNACEESCLSN